MWAIRSSCSAVMPAVGELDPHHLVGGRPGAGRRCRCEAEHAEDVLVDLAGEVAGEHPLELVDVGNGGKLTFTAIGETLKGNVKTDSISSVNMYLLSKTTYTGKTSGKVTMNVSKNSKWVVTGNSTVTNLNVADGGKIVDKDGNTVTIKVNGTTKVKGDSKYTITVTGKYSTTVTTGSSNKLSTKAVSRSAFDKYFGTTTTFGKNTED
jgi:hypothetical protein